MDSLPPELQRIIYGYKHDMESLERWWRFLHIVFDGLLTSFLNL